MLSIIINNSIKVYENKINKKINDDIKTIELIVKNKEYELAIDTVKNSFKTIKPIIYDDSYELIWSLSKTLINIPKGREYVLDILCEVDKYKNLSEEAKLYIYQKIKVLYILNENYAKASEYAIKTIDLSKNLGNTYDEVKSKIELGIIYKRINGYETGIKIIEEALKIKVEDEKQNATLKTYGLINLAQISISKENYEKAKKVCDTIPKYKKYFIEEDYRDIDIFKTIIEIEIYIHENKLEKAKEKLEYCRNLLEIDKDELYSDKDLEYLIVEGKYHWKIKEYDKSIVIYEKVLELCNIRKNNTLKEKILYDLENISEESNNHKLRDIYYNEIISFNKEQEDIRYRDYSYYIMEHMNNEVEMINHIKSKKIFYKITVVLVMLVLLFSKIIYRSINKIRYAAMYDGLTNVLNRNILDKRYKIMLTRSDNFGVIMIDVDNFKNINDTYGHAFGDIVLINICNGIKNVIRKNSNLYRYGGEEFVVLIKSNSEIEINNIAENIRLYIEQMTWNQNINITVSIGVANSNKEGKFVIEKADENLYKAKRTGKNKVVY